MSLTHYKGRGARQPDAVDRLPVVDPMALRLPQEYRATPDLAAAVNVALTLGMPLLLTGELGSGKSGLADSFSWKLATHDEHVPKPAGQKVLSLKSIPSFDAKHPQRCANAQGFSLHAEVCCAMNQRNKLEKLCRYITRPAIANERLKRNSAGDIMLQLKSPYRDGTTTSSCHRSTKSPGAILNNRRLARRAEGRMPGVIHATARHTRVTPKTQPHPLPWLITTTFDAPSEQL